MKKLQKVNFVRMLNKLHKEATKKTAKYGNITDEEINKIVQKCRHAWKANAKRTIDELAALVKANSKPSKAGFAVKSVEKIGNLADRRKRWRSGLQIRLSYQGRLCPSF